jgi:hypothetical protein
MFRCHFTHQGHVVAGEDLLATTLNEAINEAQVMLATMAALKPNYPTGFEIWMLSNLLYKSK